MMVGRGKRENSVCGRETSDDGGGERGWDALRRCVGGVWWVWDRWLGVWLRTGEHVAGKVAVHVELEQRAGRLWCEGAISALDGDGGLQLGMEVAVAMGY